MGAELGEWKVRAVGGAPDASTGGTGGVKELRESMSGTCADFARRMRSCAYDGIPIDI